MTVTLTVGVQTLNRQLPNPVFESEPLSVTAHNSNVNAAGLRPLYDGAISASNFRCWPGADLKAASATAQMVPALATAFGFTPPRSEIIRENSFFSEIPPFPPCPCASFASLLQYASPARPPCPSQFIPIVALRYVVLSPTTVAILRATVLCGMSPSRAGASLAICRYGLGKCVPSR